MQHKQMYRRAVRILIALFGFYNPLFSQESKQTNADTEKEISQSHYITANTGALEPQNLEMLQKISKANGGEKESALMLLGNAFPDRIDFSDQANNEEQSALEKQFEAV